MRIAGKPVRKNPSVPFSHILLPTGAVVESKLLILVMEARKLNVANNLNLKSETIFLVPSFPFSETCFLFSACDEVLECTECVTESNTCEVKFEWYDIIMTMKKTSRRRRISAAALWKAPLARTSWSSYQMWPQRQSACRRVRPTRTVFSIRIISTYCDNNW